MKKITREKYNKQIIERLGFIPRVNCPTITPQTETYIQHIVSFLPKKLIKYIEKNVVFHEPKHTRGENQEFAVCVNLKTSQTPDYLILIDSAFRYLKKNYKLLFIAHELGHVFFGSDENKSEEENENAANDFVYKYFVKEEKFIF